MYQVVFDSEITDANGMIDLQRKRLKLLAENRRLPQSVPVEA